MTAEPTTTEAKAPVFPTHIDDMVMQYVKLRDTIKASDDAHAKKVAPAKEYLEQLNGAILQKLTEIGAENVKTMHGTAYRTVTKSATVADAALFRQFIINTEQYDLVDMRANAPAVAAFIDGTGQGSPPPGVNYSTMVKVGIRRA